MAETKHESAFVPEGWKFGKERPKGKGYEVPAELLTTVDSCGLCGGPVKRFGRGRVQRFRDAPMLGRPTWLVFRRQRYRCVDPGPELIWRSSVESQPATLTAASE